MTRKAKIKGGGANLNPLAQLRPNTERNNPFEMTPYRPPYQNTDEPKKQTQTQTHTETPTIPIPKPIPTSTNNLFSTKIRQFNNYPEFKTNDGINEVINLLENIENILPSKKKGSWKNLKIFIFIIKNYFMVLKKKIMKIIILFYK